MAVAEEEAVITNLGIIACSLPHQSPMTPLSEKAKGKQRAVDIVEPGPSTPPVSSRELTIRFTDGLPDLVVEVGVKDAVRDVKTKV